MTMDLKMTNVGKTRGSRKALRDISFELESGQHLVVFGSNGAGKTTLLRIAALLDRPSAGEVVVSEDGESLQPAAARARMGFVTHSPQLYLDLSAEENLMLFARLYGVHPARRRVEWLLDAVELTHRRGDPVRGFSRGMMQRMAIARALVNDPGILLLDEVYSGLDPRGVDIVRHMVRHDAGRRAIIEVSHDFASGMADCTHVLVLDRGRSAGMVPRDGLTADDMRARYGAAPGEGRP